MCRDHTSNRLNTRVTENPKHTRENHMKFLLALALLSSVAMAAEAKKEEHKEAAKTEKMEAKKEEAAPAVAPEHKEVKEDKKAAYKAAKEACLKENKDLKGKELKECIVSKNK